MCEKAGYLKEIVADDCLLSYLKIKGMILVKSRDFITVARKRIYEDGSILLCQCSIPFLKFPIPPKTIRANLICGAALLTPLGKRKTHMVICQQTDLKMSIPKFLMKIILKD